MKQGYFLNASLVGKYSELHISVIFPDKSSMVHEAVGFVQWHLKLMKRTLEILHVSPWKRGRGEFDMQIANHPCLASFLRSSQWSQNILQNVHKNNCINKLFLVHFFFCFFKNNKNNHCNNKFVVLPFYCMFLFLCFL